jgi:DNA-binding NarL/FixJ family response regulator
LLLAGALAMDVGRKPDYRARQRDFRGDCGMGKLRALIVDDHQLMLDAVRLALSGRDDVEIVGEASGGTQVLPKIAATNPDVVLLDVHMPGMDGLQCLDLIQTRHPDVIVIMLSGADDPQVVEAALRRGASSFIMKQIDPRDLASAIRQSVDGTVVQAIGATQTTVNAADDLGLTEKEVSVLEAVARGLSNKQIAREAWVSEQTVKFHLKNIFRKLDVTSRTEAVHYALRNGIVQNPLYEASV